MKTARFGVLDGLTGALQISTEAGVPEVLPLFGRGRPLPDDIAARCEAMQVKQLWLHGRGFEQLEAATLRPKDAYRVRTRDGWLYDVRSKTSTYHLRVILARDAPWPGFSTLVDPRQLWQALALFSSHLGVLPHQGPGATGTRLLRRRLDKTPAALAGGFLPFPAVDADERPVDGELQWFSGLAPLAVGTPYVHCFDRQAAYLAACSRLRLGYGDAYYTTERAEIDRAIAQRLPGYFHRFDHDLSTGTGWVTLPTLAREACSAGCVDAAWLYPDSGYPLQDWYKRLRNARRAFVGPGAVNTACRAALRAVYTQAIGWLASTRWAREGDGLYRPDWRDAIVAQNRATVQAALADIPNAIGAYIDAIYVASPTADPEAARPAALRRREGMGSWQHKGCVPAVHLPWERITSAATLAREFSEVRADGGDWAYFQDATEDEDDGEAEC